MGVVALKPNSWRTQLLASWQRKQGIVELAPQHKQYGHISFGDKPGVIKKKSQTTVLTSSNSVGIHWVVIHTSIRYNEYAVYYAEFDKGRGIVTDVV